MDGCYPLCVYICICIASFVDDEENGFSSEGIKPDCLSQQPALLSLGKLSSEYTL